MRKNSGSSGRAAPARARRRRKRRALGRILLVFVLALSVGGGLVASYLGRSSGRDTVAQVERGDGPAPGEPRADGRRVTPHGRSDASAVLDPARFTGGARHAYWIATQIPEVLNQLHCWCGCVASGWHRSVLQCFEDTMGVGCGICQGTAEIAYRMVNDGIRDAGAIQKVVDARFAPPGPPTS